MKKVHSSALLDLLQATLTSTLHDAQLKITELPQTGLHLWLLNDAPLRRPFDPDEIQRVMDTPLYWSFCWASGLVLAQQIAANPHWVKDKTVLDFGCGSGVAAIAAAKAGAKKVIACDIDPLALQATRLNAQLNHADLAYSNDFMQESTPLDVILAADILYDKANMPWLDVFLKKSPQVLLADSRVRDFQQPPYQRIQTVEASTLPDLDESPQYGRVSLYHCHAKH